MRSPRERLPERNFLGGRILPRAVPFMSATRHSTSLILCSCSHSSNRDWVMIFQLVVETQRNVTRKLDRTKGGPLNPLHHGEIDQRTVLLPGHRHPLTPITRHFRATFRPMSASSGRGYTGLSAAIELAEAGLQGRGAGSRNRGLRRIRPQWRADLHRIFVGPGEDRSAARQGRCTRAALRWRKNSKQLLKDRIARH